MIRCDLKLIDFLQLSDTFCLKSLKIVLPWPPLINKMADTLGSAPSIKDVKNYWEQNPIHSVEFPILADLRTYLEEIDNLRWNDNERWAKRHFYDFDGAKKFYLTSR